MKNKTTDIVEELPDDLAEQLDIDFSEDILDAAEKEIEDLLKETGGDYRQTQSTLLQKLALYPAGNFPVSEYSMYCDDSWIIFKGPDGEVTRINFDAMSEHGVSIKKSIVYHLIPDFAPFAGIRSYLTTLNHAQNFRRVYNYVLVDNNLTEDADSLSFITPRLLNDALDRSKLAPQFTHYHYLFLHIRFWISLSVQKLIPEENRLSVSPTTVDTPERRKDVIRNFTGSIASWAPYTESDLKKLVEHALFWTEKAMPRVKEASDYIKSREFEVTWSKTITRSAEDFDLEKNLNVVVASKQILKLQKTKREYNNQAPFWQYSWTRSFQHSLTHIRDALYILLALVTGLRVSELEALKFDHVVETKNGKFKLQVTRYKTSQDPNYKGDTSFIPLPKFIGRKVKDFEHLRYELDQKREGYIFQSMLGTKKVVREASIKTEQITKRLQQQLGIDRVHTHRFRKTIAEILINRSERNVDIIRLLFGHASYAMTLRYIGRNPYIVQSVAKAIEENYIQEFTDIITSVKSSSSSGINAQRLVEKIAARPESFSGQSLKVTIFTYVTHLLSSGEPLFIHRTAVGTYCVSTEVYSSPDLPPCLAHHRTTVKDALPEPLHCDTACPHALIVGKAAQALKDNTNFYQQMLDKASDTLSETSKAMLRLKVLENTKHLEALNNNHAYKVIPSVGISV
ncbi:tyrosine-type recombinase/integrase [Pseudomonas sp. CFBP 8770]|jgi:integrase|uniref:tyrosine-type recombinase/integrase n=1 Tax=unclassified Pseudomonas TaxID=196821 RepID=UPI00177E0556|nr:MULTISPECIES: tyrosine-type recombinase/integrase [unclassified Pseudomonas]MBD8473231.1 tyrosine-type recombinase/integrase [Pseudomonas sp. CFBP 8773]MBD8646358.1 tyrosine-type recombinase/integrase [Pseudomonas sp. CFBP 8770]MBD8733482.1 tyrosine-type recombinase/integrase [Pseudomonas sp. CFBP 13710]